MPKRAAGIRAARTTIWVTGRATRKAIFRCRPPIIIRTCAPRWWRPCCSAGLNIECHHHEVATGGQCEIDQRFDTLVKSADNMLVYKYVIRNTA